MELVRAGPDRVFAALRMIYRSTPYEIQGFAVPDKILDSRVTHG
jgi:hypothetical protein